MEPLNSEVTTPTRWKQLILAWKVFKSLVERVECHLSERLQCIVAVAAAATVTAAAIVTAAMFDADSNSESYRLDKSNSTTTELNYNTVQISTLSATFFPYGFIQYQNHQGSTSSDQKCLYWPLDVSGINLAVFGIPFGLSLPTSTLQLTNVDGAARAQLTAGIDEAQVRHGASHPAGLALLTHSRRRMS